MAALGLGRRGTFVGHPRSGAKHHRPVFLGAVRLLFNHELVKRIDKKLNLLYIKHYELTFLSKKIAMTILSINLTDSGAVSAKRLIAEIIAFARESGIDQVTLASRAGISAESLSRLKKAGGCRLGTALELARVAGFKTLDLTKQSAGQVASSLSACKLSAGRRLPISAEELVLALRNREPQDRYRAHLYGFFEELPIELVHDVILDEGLDYAQLVSLTNELRAEGETVDWLAEMAGDSVANAA